jgi:BTB/POZ domain-containing protein KCTD9
MIKVIKGIFYYSGFEFIYRKIKPASEPRPLPTLPLWLIGIYVAAFGVASQRYENRVDIIENKANTIYSQLSSPNPVTKGMAFRMILDIEKMECPYKPDIKNPASIYFSFFKQTTYEGVANLMKETIVNWKGSLANVDFRRVDFRGCDLIDANLVGADLRNAKLAHVKLFRAELVGTRFDGADLWNTEFDDADLTGAELKGAKLVRARFDDANLERANLVGAELVGAMFPRANLTDTNLEGAILNGANLAATNLEGARFYGAMLVETNLNGARGLTIEQLSNVETLYKAKLDSELMEQVREKYPHLLEEPRGLVKARERKAKEMIERQLSQTQK